MIVTEAVNQEANPAFTEDTWVHDEEWVTTGCKENYFFFFFITIGCSISEPYAFSLCLAASYAFALQSSYRRLQNVLTSLFFNASPGFVIFLEVVFCDLWVKCDSPLKSRLNYKPRKNLVHNLKFSNIKILLFDYHWLWDSSSAVQLYPLSLLPLWCSYVTSKCPLICFFSNIVPQIAGPMRCWWKAQESNGSDL